MRRSPLLGADGARRAVLPLAPAAVEGFVPDFAHTPPATLCLFVSRVGDGYRDGAMRFWAQRRSPESTAPLLDTVRARQLAQQARERARRARREVLVMRIEATPSSEADGAKLADEIIARLAVVTSDGDGSEAAADPERTFPLDVRR